MNKKVLNTEEIIKLIKRRDSKYIEELEKKNKCVYKFEVSDTDFLYTEDGWKFPNDTYVLILGIPHNDYFDANEDRIAGYELNYVYGLNGDSAIIIPHQGGMDAYQIGENTICTVFHYPGEESYSWRK